VLHTFDGRHEIETIHVTAVYFVTRDRNPLVDWRERLDYYRRRLEVFHRREFDGQSKLVIEVHDEPLISDKEAAEFRRGDQNETFFKTMEEVQAALAWPPPASQGFPVLLVCSDFNWRELDDFKRQRLVDGRPVHEGFIDGQGRHFPGAESGGARAVYLPEEGRGLGLVSADGWRVPYSGSDCVVYHEGIGHPIGLPHPEPIDDSVMGTAQYRYWLNETWVERSQKRALGWRPPPRDLERPNDLFSRFTAVPEPAVPKPGQPVELALTWSDDAEVASVRLRLQTELRGAWREVPVEADGPPPPRLELGEFAEATPVSYRLDVILKDGQQVELWGYFQVAEP